MCLNKGAKTRVRIETQLSEEFFVRVGVHQGSVLSPLLFSIVLDVISENVKEGLMYEILYADDLVLISENMDDLKEKFYKWKEAFETKGLKVNLRKTKVIMSGIEGKITKSKIDSCGVCGKRVMFNSVLCKNAIHGFMEDVQK